MDVATEIRKPNQDEALIHIESLQAGIATHSSDPVTMLQNPVGYDPKRIPSSIFSARPSSPMEWSIASTESLFSINMGDASLSRENFMTLYKSGELAKLDDTVKSGAKPDDQPTIVSKPDEPSSTYFQPRLASVMEGENMYKIPEEDHEKGPITANVTADSAKDAIVQTSEVQNQRKMTASGDISIRSAESLSSVKSFEFPVLKSDVGRNCSMNEMGMVEKPQAQPATTPKKSSNSWFSCFPCFSPSSTKT